MRLLIPFLTLMNACVMISSEKHQENIEAIDESKDKDKDNDGLYKDEDCDDNDASQTMEIECLDIGINFIWLPAGNFDMGSPEQEVGRDSDEQSHDVSLIRDFYIMDSELTQAQYRYFTDGSPSQNEGDDFPVETISWDYAARFSNYMSDEEDLENCYDCQTQANDTVDCTETEAYNNIYDCTGYRLPTEAEWEYAARSGTDKAFWTSTLDENDIPGADLPTDVDISNCIRIDLTDETPLLDFANYCDDGADGIAQATTAVRQLNPNGFDLYDMHGNVWEWIHDNNGNYPDDDIDPVNFDGGNNHIIRGGGFDSVPEELRCASRDDENRNTKRFNLGFRLVKSASVIDPM